MPAIFYLSFGEVNAFGLSLAASLVALCLLVALGHSAAAGPGTPTHEAPRGIGARVGSFWLVACAFGPFLGWLVTAPAFPLTESDWWWRYAARATLCVGLPVLTAAPLLPYARGRRWYVALPLLLGVTSLAAWSGANTLLDLREGPTVLRATGYHDPRRNSFSPAAEGRPFRLTTLKHTGRAVKIEPAD